ncbi:MAG: MerR family transcriptional regulator, light-induced transcriptional regulator [Solirubrobacteraceae bacterium]|jgi:DICT domain-containing protein|nr:MerR family transcriptional regulator, light-induced transcriptional regulator [Solirubrobacteraceae bacterium]
MSGLPIRAVAEQTGVAAGTIRQWEQRYGFPEPKRTPAGYREYSDADVQALLRVVELRRTGLSVAAAVERVRERATPAPQAPSIFGAVPHEGRARPYRKKTLIALSRAIEDQMLASASCPIIFGAFQRERFYRGVEHRYRRMAQSADMVAVFAEFPAIVDEPGAPIEVPIDTQSAIGHEWAVVVDAPGFAACLAAWEPPVADAPALDIDRMFEAFWTLDPAIVRSATRAGAAIARETAPAVADRIEALLVDRSVGSEASTAALEALTGRMVAYMDDDRI